MINWEEVAVKVCKDRGLELLSLFSEGGYYFVKNSEGRPFPLAESRLDAWVQAELDKYAEEEE